MPGLCRAAFEPRLHVTGVSVLSAELHPQSLVLFLTNSVMYIQNVQHDALDYRDSKIVSVVKQINTVISLYC